MGTRYTKFSEKIQIFFITHRSSSLLRALHIIICQRKAGVQKVDPLPSQNLSHVTWKEMFIEFCQMMRFPGK